MKTWAGTRMLVTAIVAVIATVFFITPFTYATQHIGDDTENVVVNDPVVIEDLYRVRQGDEASGEVAGRFYIERNILRAESELAIVGDYDPDGDGWALVGHTAANNDGKSMTYFWTDPVTNVPHILLDAHVPASCAQLRPSDLGVVTEGEDRLLSLEFSQICMRPMFIVIPATDGEPVQPDADSSDVDELQEDEIAVGEPDVQEVEVVTTPTPQATDMYAVQQADGLTAESGLVQVVPATGSVAGVVTVASPKYFDNPDEKAKDTSITTKVTDTFIVGGSIVSAILLGIFLLARTTFLLNK